MKTQLCPQLRRTEKFGRHVVFEICNSSDIQTRLFTILCTPTGPPQTVPLFYIMD